MFTMILINIYQWLPFLYNLIKFIKHIGRGSGVRHWNKFQKMTKKLLFFFYFRHKHSYVNRIKFIKKRSRKKYDEKLDFLAIFSLRFSVSIIHHFQVQKWLNFFFFNFIHMAKAKIEFPNLGWETGEKELKTEFVYDWN